jgi:hypothetical protein
MSEKHPEFVVLEGIKEGNRFYSTHDPDRDETKLLNGEVAYKILGYANTTEEAHKILGYTDPLKKSLVGYTMKLATGVYKCAWCETTLMPKVDRYPHSSGWEVQEYRDLQWLSTRCPKCGYDWSLEKLGPEFSRHE